MLTLADIVAATGGVVIGHDDGWVTGVSTDSRTITPNDLFVPLVGPRFDGHDYISQVASRGVTLLLAEETWATAHLFPPGVTAVVVKNTLKALGDLAAAHRRQFGIPVVGVTGSNGKTTTKEMLAAIMAVTGPGLKTAGNLNNLIGLPRMIFQMHDGLRWAILEMGMSEPGEIDRLAEIAQPRVGIITNVFPAHLESMGTVENIAKAKGELFQRLPEGGTAVLNANDPRVALLPTPVGVRRLTFGMETADVMAMDITRLGLDGQRFTLCFDGVQIPVRLHACGRHALMNALAATAAAHALGIEPGTIRAGLEQFRPADRRFTVEQVGQLTLIDDSYNANPASMAAALATLAEVKDGRQAFIALGDMLELGPETERHHRNLGAQAARLATRLYLKGALASVVAEGAVSAGLDPSRIVITESHEEIAADILKESESGDLVLVKGSRGMGMDRIAQLLRETLNGTEANQ